MYTVCTKYGRLSFFGHDRSVNRYGPVGSRTGTVQLFLFFWPRPVRSLTGPVRSGLLVGTVGQKLSIVSVCAVPLKVKGKMPATASL